MPLQRIPKTPAALADGVAKAEKQGRQVIQILSSGDEYLLLVGPAKKPRKETRA